MGYQCLLRQMWTEIQKTEKKGEKSWEKGKTCPLQRMQWKMSTIKKRDLKHWGTKIRDGSKILD